MVGVFFHATLRRNMSNIKPEVWGGSLWILLHSVVEQAVGNSQVSEKMYNLFEHVVPKIIPCDDCRQGYIKFKNANPIHSWRFHETNETRSLAKVWLWNLHETVNRRLNKRSPEIKDLERLYRNNSISLLLDNFVSIVGGIIGSGSATQDPSKTIEAQDVQQFKGIIRSLEYVPTSVNYSTLHL
jgi:hypothetical protein